MAIWQHKICEDHWSIIGYLIVPWFVSNEDRKIMNKLRWMKLIVKKKYSLLTHTPAVQVVLIAFRVQSIVHETAMQRRLKI